MASIIKVRGLTKKYKELTALDKLDLDVEEGRILGLLGPNGSGKSTLINCILSLLNFDQGTIELYGQEMTPEAYDIKRKIGVVFQDVGVFEELNVYENIDYFCGLYILDKKERKFLVEEAIKLVGLENFRKFRPKQLSGGLLRRLNIACGIAHKPDLIFFDEPTVAVDPQSRNNILEGVKELNKKGATIVYTSHYMDEVEMLCDDIVIIDRGRVIAKGSSEELKDLIDLHEKITFDLEKADEEKLSKLRSLDNVLSVDFSNRTCRVAFSHGKDNLIRLINFLKEEGIDYGSLSSEKPSLNDVFLELTGKDLRD